MVEIMQLPFVLTRFMVTVIYENIKYFISVFLFLR